MQQDRRRILKIGKETKHIIFCFQKNCGEMQDIQFSLGILKGINLCLLHLPRFVPVVYLVSSAWSRIICLGDCAKHFYGEGMGLRQLSHLSEVDRV